MQKRRVDRVVVGGGAMGLATAWQLARTGVSVVILEQFDEGHAEGASHGATRNMNNAYAAEHFLDLYELSFAQYRELEAASGEQLLDLCGLVTHGDSVAVSAAHEALVARGISADMLTPEDAGWRWPGMRFETPVLYSSDAGRIRAADVLRTLSSEARNHGATVLWRTRAVSINVEDDERVTVEAISADGTPVALHASGVVVAAGAWSRPLLENIEGITLPTLRVTEEHPAHFQAAPGFDRDSLGDWPSFNHLRPMGREAGSDPSIYGMFTPGEGVKVGFHGVGEQVDPDARPHTVTQEQQRALTSYVAEWLPGLDPQTADWVSCTYTSTPTDDFILDRIGPVTIGAGFSGQGFKFVPGVGKVLAETSLGIAAPAFEWTLAAHEQRALADRERRLSSFWNRARAAEPHLPLSLPLVWSFGANERHANELLGLVIAGVKTGTASSLWDYEAANDPIPEVGELSVITDGSGRPRAVIRTTDVQVIPFNAVSEEHAYSEGEDDRTLNSWRREHEYYWRTYSANERGFDPEMPIICERFELVFHENEDDG